MRRKRRKKIVYRKSTPILMLSLLIMICSGAVLTVIAKNGDISFGLDEMSYITGAIATQGAIATDQNASENVDDTTVQSNEPVAPKGTEVQPDVINKEETVTTDTDVSIIESVDQSSTTDDTTVVSNNNKKGLIQMLLCTSLAYGTDDSGKNNDITETYENQAELKVVSSAVTESQVTQVEQTVPVVSDINGAVFIYHTHSTESYEPYSDGNYHVTGDQGTVRNVASNLKSVLESKGIKVYHDTTLHDNPSYKKSYGRSLSTAQNYLSQYSDITVMIDLHRDAMAPGGKKYNTIEVNGGKATSFNIVVGKQNDNYNELMKFANQVISKANELYPGLGGRIIQREYKFNEFLSNHYMLIEVGNNGNTIEEAEMTGRLLGDVVEAVMREI